MLAGLLDDARCMHPDHLAPSIDRWGRHGGVDDAVAYVVDRDQRRLSPLPGSGAPDQPVEGSAAGRCFQAGDPVDGGDHGRDGGNEGADGDDPGFTWFPMIVGGDRIGVLRARIDRSDPEAPHRAARLAGLAGHLIATRAAVCDRVGRLYDAHQLTLAAEMRWAALPPLGFDDGRVSLGAMLQPAYEIAGDTFDYAVDGSTFHLGIFDAVGHGLRASQLANIAVYAYRLGRRSGSSLEDIYRSIDDAVAAQFGDEVFVTAQLVTIDLESGGLRCICAGHPNPIVVRGGTSAFEMPSETCLPLGMGHRDVDVTERRLEPGDILAYYSDGVSEARSPGGDEFGPDRLADLLLQAAGSGVSPAEAARRVLHTVGDHHDDRLDDDATLVLVHWRGPGGGPPPASRE